MEISRMSTEEKTLRDKHPKWREYAINDILNTTGTWAKARLEALYEAPCVKCGREMGEHIADPVGHQYVCPTPGQTTSRNPLPREELEELAERAAVSASALVGTKIAQEIAKKEEEEGLHHSPISPHCEAVLETPPKCWDFRGIRSYVMCKAWDLMEKEKRTRLPVGEAWMEARKVCRME
jgi:hypothetical protein